MVCYFFEGLMLARLGSLTVLEVQEGKIVFLSGDRGSYTTVKAPAQEYDRFLHQEAVRVEAEDLAIATVRLIHPLMSSIKL